LRSSKKNKWLVQEFGEAVFDLIEQYPERLQEVTGIGTKRVARIIAGWAEQKVIREIMMFLHANGVGTSRAVRVISANPYRLRHRYRQGDPMGGETDRPNVGG
jgi:exodeoxyribonuclease V alpha subunit